MALIPIADTIVVPAKVDGPVPTRVNISLISRRLKKGTAQLSRLVNLARIFINLCWYYYYTKVGLKIVGHCNKNTTLVLTLAAPQHFARISIIMTCRTQHFARISKIMTCETQNVSLWSLAAQIWFSLPIVAFHEYTKMVI